MHVQIVAPSGAGKPEWAHALHAGIRRHRDRASIIDRSTPTQDVVACWGWRKGQRYKRRGHRVLVMERGYVGDRRAWMSLGWDGLNGRARFPNIDDGGARWMANFPDAMKPWQEGGKYVLIAGQVANDAAVANINIRRWYADMAAALTPITPLPVYYRPHPVEVERDCAPVIEGAKTMDGTLASALESAAVVVTWNSNVGVDAALAGVPVVACDEGSMAWPVASHSICTWPERPRRDEWASKLGWCQWTMDEVQDGTAWAYVKGAMA